MRRVNLALRTLVYIVCLLLVSGCVPIGVRVQNMLATLGAATGGG